MFLLTLKALVGLIFNCEVEEVDLIEFETFLEVDMRIGRVIRVESFPEAVKPAIKLWIDFGEDIGLKQSSAQITVNYSHEDLIGKNVVAVVNLKSRRIASFTSEVLVLGAMASNGITLLTTDKEVKFGQRIQ